MGMLEGLIDVKSLKDSSTTLDIKKEIEKKTSQVYTLRQVSKMCTHAGLYPAKVKGKTIWLFNKRDKTNLVEYIKRLKIDHRLTGFMTSKQIEKVTNMDIKSLWGTFKKMGIVNVGKGKSNPMWRIETESAHDEITYLFNGLGNRAFSSAELLKMYNANYSHTTIKSLAARLSCHSRIQQHDTNPVTWSLL